MVEFKLCMGESPAWAGVYIFQASAADCRLHSSSSTAQNGEIMEVALKTFFCLLHTFVHTVSQQNFKCHQASKSTSNASKSPLKRRHSSIKNAKLQALLLSFLHAKKCHP
eukprot:scaffold93201_cov16-Tisochrysis_lutea.AAC.1